MNRLRVYLLPPGWDISPLQGHPPAFNQAFLTVHQYPFTLVGGERNTLTNFNQFIPLFPIMIKSNNFTASRKTNSALTSNWNTV